MRRFGIIVGILVLLAIGVVLLVRTGSAYVWPYNYRDQGGHTVFATRGFDLILLDREWESEGFRAGGSVLITREMPGLSLPDDSVLKPQFTEPGRLELSFPDLTVAIIDGQRVEIDGVEVELESYRVEIIVEPDGGVVVIDAPFDAGHHWSTLEHIRALSSYAEQYWAQLGEDDD